LRSPFSNSSLLPGFVRMVASEIEKFDLRVFVLVDVGVRSLVVGNVVKRHSGSLPPQLIAHERETGTIQGGPDFLDVVVIHYVRLTDGKRIEGYGQNALQCTETVLGYEERLYDVGPETVASGDGKLVLVPDQHARIWPKAGRRWFVDHVHGQGLVAGVF